MSSTGVKADRDRYVSWGTVRLINAGIILCDFIFSNHVSQATNVRMSGFPAA